MHSHPALSHTGSTGLYPPLTKTALLQHLSTAQGARSGTAHSVPFSQPPLVQRPLLSAAILVRGVDGNCRKTDPAKPSSAPPSVSPPSLSPAPSHTLNSGLAFEGPCGLGSSLRAGPCLTPLCPPAPSTTEVHRGAQPTLAGPNPSRVLTACDTRTSKGALFSHVNPS